MADNLSRREFLRVSTVAAAGLAVAACTPAKPQEATTAAPAATVAQPATQAALPDWYSPVGKSVISMRKPDVTGHVEAWDWGIREAWQNYADEFVKVYPKVTVDVKLQDEGGIFDKLTVSLAAGSGFPDYCEMGPDVAWGYAQKGALVDITELSKPFEAIWPASVQKFTLFDGKRYIMPYNTDAWCCFYRRDVYEKAGVKPEDIETWDDFIRVGQEVAKVTGSKMLNIPTTDVSLLPALLNQAHLGIFQEDTGEIIIDKPEAVAALQPFFNIEKSGIAAIMDDWSAPWYAAMKDGSLATWISGLWLDSFIKKNAPDTKGLWGAYKLPAQTKGGLRAANAGASCIALMALGKNQEAAFEYQKWVTLDPEMVNKAYEKFAKIPAALPEYDSPAMSAPDPFYNGMIWGQFAKEAYLATPWGWRYGAHSQEALAQVNAELTLARQGKKTLEQALKDAAQYMRDQKW